MEKNELLTEEMSDKEYAKKVKALRKAFMSEFAKDAFIAFNDDFKNNTEVIANAARETSFDKQALKNIYKRYNKYKEAFEAALTAENIRTNKPSYLEKAAAATKELKALKGDVAKALVALKKGKMAIKKGADKKFDQKVKDRARVVKYNKDQAKRKPARLRQESKDAIKYYNKKQRQDFVNRVKSKVAKINFVTGK